MILLWWLLLVNLLLIRLLFLDWLLIRNGHNGSYLMIGNLLFAPTSSCDGTSFTFWILEEVSVWFIPFIQGTSSTRYLPILKLTLNSFSNRNSLRESGKVGSNHFFYIQHMKSSRKHSNQLFIKERRLYTSCKLSSLLGIFFE